MKILLALMLLNFLWAEPLGVHKKAIHDYNLKIAKYEGRLNQLKKRKYELREGEELDELLNEIAEIHRDILTIRKKRVELKKHLESAHAGSDLSFAISLHRRYEKKRSNGKKDPVDDKLDNLLTLVRSQYARYISYKPVLGAKQGDVKKKVEKSKKKAKEKTRKEYIQEHLKTEMEE